MWELSEIWKLYLNVLTTIDWVWNLVKVMRDNLYGSFFITMWNWILSLWQIDSASGSWLLWIMEVKGLKCLKLCVEKLKLWCVNVDQHLHPYESGNRLQMFSWHLDPELNGIWKWNKPFYVLKDSSILMLLTIEIELKYWPFVC